MTDKEKSKFSKEETEAFILEIGKRYGTIESKQTSQSANDVKTRDWADILVVMHHKFPQKQRAVISYRNKWSKMKDRARKYDLEKRKEGKLTGGGVSKHVDDETMETICAIMRDQLVPPSSKYDDDASESKPCPVKLEQIRHALIQQFPYEDDGCSAVIDVEDDSSSIASLKRPAMDMKYDNGLGSSLDSPAGPSSSKQSKKSIKSSDNADDIYVQILKGKLAANETKARLRVKQERMFDERFEAAKAEKEYWVNRSTREHCVFLQAVGQHNQVPSQALMANPMLTSALVTPSKEMEGSTGYPREYYLNNGAL